MFVSTSAGDYANLSYKGSNEKAGYSTYYHPSHYYQEPVRMRQEVVTQSTCGGGSGLSVVNYAVNKHGSYSR